jgi:hypothetical protein
MNRFELTKSIEARKVSPRTKIPTNEFHTIPFGAIIDDVVENGEVNQFKYLGEYYQYPRADLKHASRPATPVN